MSIQGFQFIYSIFYLLYSSSYCLYQIRKRYRFFKILEKFSQKQNLKKIITNDTRPLLLRIRYSRIKFKSSIFLTIKQIKTFFLLLKKDLNSQHLISALFSPFIFKVSFQLEEICTSRDQLLASRPFGLEMVLTLYTAYRVH